MIELTVVERPRLYGLRERGKAAHCRVACQRKRALIARGGYRGEPCLACIAVIELAAPVAAELRESNCADVRKLRYEPWDMIWNNDHENFRPK